jgi:hypothetical protein
LQLRPAAKALTATLALHANEKGRFDAVDEPASVVALIAGLN